MCIYIYINIHMCMYIYIYIHTHIYMCAHSYIALDSITQHAQDILKSPFDTKFPIEIANKSDV